MRQRRGRAPADGPRAPACPSRTSIPPPSQEKQKAEAAAGVKGKKQSPGELRLQKGEGCVGGRCAGAWVRVPRGGGGPATP